MKEGVQPILWHEPPRPSPNAVQFLQKQDGAVRAIAAAKKSSRLIRDVWSKAGNRIVQDGGQHAPALFDNEP
jgi:hypothetical protein